MVLCIPVISQYTFFLNVTFWGTQKDGKLPMNIQGMKYCNQVAKPLQEFEGAAPSAGVWRRSSQAPKGARSAAPQGAESPGGGALRDAVESGWLLSHPKEIEVFQSDSCNKIK